MAYTLSISPFSFIRFAPDPAVPCCDDAGEFLLPVALYSDIQFQFSFVFGSNADATTAFAEPFTNLQLILLKGVGNTPATIATNKLYDFTTTGNYLLAKFKTAPDRVTYTWPNGLVGFNNYLACNACFQVAVVGTVGGDNVTLISNGFIRECDTCYSSVIDYGSDNNYADFVYCNTNSFANRVRLPFSLGQPQPKFDRAVYRESGGVVRRNKSLITKEYAADSDYLPESIHDRLIIALEHDRVTIQSNHYNGGISASDYEIDWQEGQCTAKAKFKAIALPFFVKRSNCSTC